MIFPDNSKLLRRKITWMMVSFVSSFNGNLCKKGTLSDFWEAITDTLTSCYSKIVDENNCEISASFIQLGLKVGSQELN